jgi:outer membrane immunogenic protein
MKTLEISTSIFLLSSVSALAADLPTIKSAPTAAPTPMWAGFYAGLNVGGIIGASNNVSTNGYSTFDWAAGALSMPFGFTSPYRTGNASVDQAGVIGGGQLGYNYAFNKNIILGLETDFQGSGFSGSGSSYGLTATTDRNGTLHMQEGQVSTNAGISWIGTARARLGYLLTPSLLVFGTGGLAYGNTYANVNTYGFHWHPQDEPSHPHPPNAVTPTFTSINTVSAGWIVGGGAEWMFIKNWSAKVEALYYNLGSQNVAAQYSPLINNEAPNSIALINAATTKVNYQGVIVRTGVNYHFNILSAPVVAKF